METQETKAFGCYHGAVVAVFFYSKPVFRDVVLGSPDEDFRLQ